MKKKPDKANNKKRGPEKSSVRQAAEAAGISRHQMYQAMKLASVPRDEFEAMVESDDPPTPSEAIRRHENKPTKPTARRLKTCPHCGGDLTTEDPNA